MKQKDTPEIIKEIIDSLEFKFNCLSVTPSGGNFILATENTYWLRPIKRITIAGKKYSIESIVIDESITVKPIGHNIAPLTGEIFDIQKPFFRHGTARKINEEISKINPKDKLPFVWLYELVKDRIITDKESRIGIECEARIFIFDESNPEGMNTEDHYNDVIRPLRNLAREINTYIDSKPGKYLPLEFYDIIYLPDWGQFNNFKGMDGKIFDEKWSGLQVDFNLSVKKNVLCCSNC